MKVAIYFIAYGGLSKIILMGHILSRIKKEMTYKHARNLFCVYFVSILVLFSALFNRHPLSIPLEPKY